MERIQEKSAVLCAAKAAAAGSSEKPRGGQAATVQGSGAAGYGGNQSPVDHSAEIAENETWLDKVRQLIRQNKLAAFSALVILLIIIMAIFAPVFAPYDPAAQSLKERLAAPSAAHWLGTDKVGRDIFSRVIYGARISLVIGLVPTLISMVIGTVLGLFAGYYGGKVDFVIMRFADIMLAFPSLLLAMVVMYTLGGGIINIFIALSLVNWASTARVVRAQTLSLKEAEYVEAARSIGVRKMTIIFRHILPNCLPSLIVLFTLNIPAAILSESSLSFLGVGAQPPSASWGLAVTEGKKYLFSEPWIPLAPSVAIMILVMAFNFLGDGLRDVLDPYLKEQ